MLLSIKEEDKIRSIIKQYGDGNLKDRVLNLTMLTIDESWNLQTI